MATGVILLILCIVGGSFIGPSSNMLLTEEAWVKTMWANALRIIYLIPLVIAEIYFTDGYKAKMSNAWTMKNFLLILITTILFTFNAWTLMYTAANLI